MSTPTLIHAEVLSSLANLLGLMEDVEQKTIKEWLPQELKNDEPLNIHECHTIDNIGQTPGINGVQLAERLNMTRGGMSKILSKLQQRSLILSSRSEDNQKEIYYHLTQKGEEIFLAHAKIQQRVGKKLIQTLTQYTEKDLTKVNKCLESLVDILWQETNQ